MAMIEAWIRPVQTDVPLRQALSEDFPRDCENLPIAGGWGYSAEDAIVFVRDLFPGPSSPDYVGLEYHIAQKIIYEELIVFQPRDRQFSGIELDLDTQELLPVEGREYDCLNFLVTSWSDLHWDQLKAEWEENDRGRRAGFDCDAHMAKRSASQVTYRRTLWFDVTDVIKRF
jgi:hypothetical protein